MTNLNKYKTPASAAKAFYREVLSAARDQGSPEQYVKLLSPKDSEALGYGKVWRVMWEGGPDEWGIKASFGDMSIFYVDYSPQSPKNWYLEPYHSFDVGFIPHRV